MGNLNSTEENFYEVKHHWCNSVPTVYFCKSKKYLPGFSEQKIADMLNIDYEPEEGERIEVVGIQAITI